MSTELKEDILAAARAVGFDLAGVTSPEPLEGRAYLAWRERGYAGTMDYLRRNVEKRLDPCLLVPDTKAILCLGVNYAQPCSETPPGMGRISVYAWGRDYHLVVKAMLHRLAGNICDLLGREFSYRAFVDSAPVMEKALAQRAGLGWIGKNGCLINRRIGSFFFLGELFLDFELPPDEPEKNHCGTCTGCMDACPTRAIVSPGVLDARRCISYLTIEHRGEIDAELAGQMGDRLFGCDTCQQVCPFNRRNVETTVEDFRRSCLGPHVDPSEILNWDETSRDRRTADSAGERASLDQWRRNARIVLANASKP